MPKTRLLLLVSSLIIVSVVSPFAQSKSLSTPNDFATTIKSLGRIPDGYTVIPPSIKFGPKFNHVAYAAYSDNNKHHQIVRLDDTTLPGIYYAVQEGFPIFSPDAKRLAYIIYMGNSGQDVAVIVNKERGPVFDNADHFIFSKDGSRYAYRAVKGKKQCVVIDGVQERYFDGIPIENNFKFSPDSKHFVYVGYEDGKCRIVRDGIEDSNNFEFIKDMKYSSDSKHLAYKARLKKIGMKEKWCVVYDSAPGNIYARIFDLSFNADASHLGYTALKNQRMVIVLDGTVIAEHFRIGIPVFSPDGKNFAYAYVQNKAWYIMLNGKQSPAFDGLEKFYFSYDSKRYAYIAKANDKWFCVINGIKNKFGFGKGISAFKFSPDSSRYAYAGINEVGGNIVVDGKPGHDYMSAGEPYFSFNSKHVVYKIRRKKDNRWKTVLNGQIVPKPYNAIGEYFFSYDSKHLAYNALINFKKSVMVVDGKEQCAENNFNILSGPYFSPDSNHISYHARSVKNKWKLVIDGTILPETYAGFMKGTPMVYDTLTKFHTIGFRMPGPEFVRIEVEIPNSSKIQTSIE